MNFSVSIQLISQTIYQEIILKKLYYEPMLAEAPYELEN